MGTSTFLFQHKRIYYRVTGQGKPVILLHGFGEDGNVWHEQVDFLQEHFRVIVPDIPGSGQSELLPDGGMEVYAEVVKVLCDIEAKEEPVTLIGHSMGGYITLAFAEKYPNKLRSFGLFHSSAFADTEEKKEVRRKATEFIHSKGAFTFLKTSIPNLFTPQYRDQHNDKVEQLIDSGKDFTNEALTQYYEAMIARPDRTAVLKAFSNPVLFIIGQHDQAVPFEASMKQCYLPAISHVHILRQTAHMGMWEETEKANRILFSFLTN